MLRTLLKGTTLLVGFIAIVPLSSCEELVEKPPSKPAPQEPAARQHTYIRTYIAATATSEVVLNIERDSFGLLAFTMPSARVVGTRRHYG